MTRQGDESGDSKYHKKFRHRDRKSSRKNRSREDEPGDTPSNKFLASLKKKLLEDDYQIQGVNFTSEDRVERIAGYYGIFKNISPKMADNIGEQMSVNRCIREGLQRFSAEQEIQIARDLLSTTMDEHYVSTDGLSSGLGVVLYKFYTRTVNTGHQNMILPVELKSDVLEAAQWVKAKGKERIYGSNTPDHYDGLRFDADSEKHNHEVYGIWDGDYYDIEQFMRHHDDKLEPKDIQRSASAAEEKKDETSDTDSTFDESDASTITNNDPKSKARAYVERNKYDNSVKNMYKALRPVGSKSDDPLVQLQKQSGALVDLEEGLRAELENVRTDGFLVKSGFDHAETELLIMESGRDILASKTAGVFYKRMISPIFDEDLNQFMALLLVIEQCEIPVLESFADRGILGLMELVAQEYPLPESGNSYGFLSMAQRTWQLIMDSVYKAPKDIKQEVMRYVTDLSKKNQATIILPRNLEQRDLFDVINQVLLSLRGVQDASVFTSVTPDQGLLVDIIVTTFTNAFGAASDNVVRNVFMLWIEGYNHHMIQDFRADNEDMEPESVETAINKMKLTGGINMRVFKNELCKYFDLPQCIQAFESAGNEVHVQTVQMSSGAAAERPGHMPTRKSLREAKTGKAHFDKDSRDKDYKMSKSEKNAKIEKELADAAPVFALLARENGKTHEICHQHLRNQSIGEEGTFNPYCRHKLAQAVKDRNEEEMDMDKLQYICRGVYNDNSPGEHKYSKPTDVPESMMARFLKHSCKHCKGTFIVVVKGNDVPNHGIWMGHGHAPRGKTGSAHCPAEGDLSHTALKKRDDAYRKWNNKVERGVCTYIKISDVDSLVKKWRPLGYVTACWANIPDTDTGHVTFESYDPAPKGGSTAASAINTTDNQAHGVLGHQNEIIEGLRKENSEQRKRIEFLERALERARAPRTVGSAMHAQEDYGDTNPRFDHDGIVTVPVFVQDGDVSTPRNANAVLDNARVETQQMKSVYPVHMIKKALSVAPYADDWNSSGLSASQLWEQDYMVYHASDPERAVRLTMKDIQLSDDM